MSIFASPARLTSWAGIAPGANESAGKVKSTRCRPGNTYLKGALGIAALSACRSKDTFLAHATSGSRPDEAITAPSSPWSVRS